MMMVPNAAKPARRMLCHTRGERGSIDPILHPIYPGKVTNGESAARSTQTVSYGLIQYIIREPAYYLLRHRGEHGSINPQLHP